MNLSAQFKAFLLSQKKRPSEVTVKNYLADVSQFISWCEKNGTAFIPHQISHKMLQDYLAAKQLSLASRERHLSSLRKFFTFLKEEKLVTELPFPSSTKPTSDDPWSLHDFRSHLTLNKASHPTVKNYLTDIKHFTSWIASKHAKLGTQAISHSYFALVTDKALEEYKASLQESGFSTPSINRKLSSLRRYLHWASEKGLPEAKSVSIANISKKKEPVINEANQATMNQAAIDTTLPSPTSLTDPLGILNPVKGTISGTTEPVQNTEATPSTKEELTQSFHAIMHEPKNPSYSRFAPLRLVQKLRHGIILALDVTIVAGTAYVIEHMAYMRWIASGKQIFTASAKNGLSHGDSKNSSFSLKLFAQLGTLASQFMAVVYPPAHSYRHDMAKHHKAFYHMRHTRPNWYKKYHELPMVHYFHFAALVIMMSAIGFMGYRAFFDDTGTSQAALPTAPPRVLSFQGRLTDNFDNPIDSATSLRFAIYNDLSASGAAMLWQEVQSTTPDQDGIFSVLLGSSTSIPDSVFRENSALYLGITVGTDSELQPRQQIATVAFAANSESLQGLLPITAGGAGTSNVVLALDSTGNLTIGGSATPTFEATGGQFTLSGNVLNLTTTAGTNSNVQLNPDGTGTVDVMKPLQNSTLNNNIPSAAGAVEVNDMFAVLATSSGQSAFTLNQDGAGPILSASSSGIARFTVSNNGTGYFAGNVGIGTTTPAYKLDVQGGSGVVGRFSGRVIGAEAVNTNEFVTLSQLNSGVSGSTFWQLNSNALSPINSTYDVLVGSTATSSALVKLGGTSNATSFFNTGGNVGIGTTAPAAKLDISTDGAGPQTLLTLRGASTGINQSYSFVMNADKTVTISGGSSNTKTIFQATNASGFAPLAVRGASGQTSNLFQVENSSGTALSVFNGSGNLGIGTTTPGSLVDIYGASPTLTFRNSGGPNLADTGVILFSETVAPAGIKLRYDGSTGTGGGTFNITDITSGVNTDLVSVMRNGNVGIGTTTPGSKLHVNGSAFFNTNTETTPFVIGRTNLTSEVLQIGINDANLNMNYVNDEASSRWNFGVQNTDTESGGGVNASNYTILTLYGSTGGGNVGIGSITPGYKLDVQDGTGIVARFSGRVIGADAVNTNEFVTLSQLTSGTGQYWTQTGGNLYPSTITDNVGIGTSLPGAKLEVSNANTGNGLIYLRNTGTSAGDINGIDFRHGSDGRLQSYIRNEITSGWPTKLHFGTAAGANNAATRMTIGSDGNVGVGTTSPTSLFAVGSTSQFQVNSSGAIAAATGVVSSGNIDLSSLSAGGMVKADVTTGRLSVATAGTDYEVPLTFGNGLTRTSNAVSLGGTITGNTDIALGGYNFTLSGLGNVGIGTTTPSSKLSLVSNGSVANLFDITDNGSTIFQVTQSNIVANVPAQFNAAGDVSIAYDLNFTNPTASYIKSSAPLYMTAGEVFGSSDLTLRTYNSGNVIVDSQALSVTGSATVSGQLTVGGTTTLSNYTTNGGVLYTNGSGTIAQSDAPATNECLTYNGTSPVWDSCASGGGITGSGTLNYLPKFTPNGSTLGDSTIYDNGNVGIGTTTPGYKLDVVSNGTADTLRVRSTAVSGQARITLTAGSGGLGQIDNTIGDFYLTNAAATGNMIFRTNNTEYMRLSSTGNFGIGTTNPLYKLTVQGDGRFTGNLGLGATAPVANRVLNSSASYTTTGYGLFSSVTGTDASVYGSYNTVSATGTLTANRGFYGSYNSVTSTADDGMFQNSLYGAYNQVQNSNGTTYDTAYGSYNLVQNNDTTLTATTSAATLGYVLNNSTGTLSNAYGTQGQVINNTTGTISNARGLFGYVRNDDGTMTTAYGTLGQVQQLEAGGVISSAFGGRFTITQTAGTITTGYGIYIDDVQATTQYALYQAGATDTNYFAGNVGIGTTSPASLLSVGSTSQFQVNSSGAIAAATGITSSGNITFSGLTAARAVFTTTGGLLTTTGTSADLAASLSNETGTGVAVFGTSPSITTALNTGSTTFSLVNTTATTLNFAGAATNITMGATTGTTTIRNATTALTGVLNVNGSGNSYFTGNLGIGSTSPGKKLDVAGDINMTSGLYYNNSPLNIELTRTLPTTANDYVEIGTMTVGSGAHNLRISVTVPSTGFSTSKTYLIPLSYNQTNDVWQTALPISDSGEYSGNNYALDVKVGTTIATLRLRRTAGTTAGTAYVRLESTGYTSDAFATLTGTGTTTAPSANLATTSITQTNGRLGVGTNSPSYLLDVQGGTGIVGQFSGRVIGADAVNSNEFVTLSQLTSGTGQYWTDAGTYIYPTGGEVLGNSASAGSNKIAGIYLADSAPVTFGTDNDVTFSFSGSELAISQGNNDINFDSNTLVIDGATNRVGIGTTAPGEELDVIGEIQFGAGTRKGRLFAQDSGFTPNPGSSTLGAVLEGAYQGHLALDLLNNDAGDSIAFRYSAGNTGAVDTVGFVMKANGNVGIGSITPAHKLDVAGTGQFTGLLTLGAQATGTTHAVRADRDLIAGSGLTGGGNLTADRTFNVGAGSCITVAADSVAVTGNCVDATTLDSIDSGSFLRSDTSDQFTSGTLTFNSGTTLDINGDLSIADTNIVFDGASTNFATTGNFSINTSQFFINQSNGYVGLGTTSPTSKLSLVSDGTVANLFDITDNGSTIFQVTQANMISNVPAQFNAAGDVSIAYDLLFTNPTASNIQSLSPLTISAGETFNSSNLTLQTYNAGNVVVDSQALTLTGSATIAAELTLSSKTTNGGVLYTNGSGTIAQSDAPATNECLTYNGTSPVWDSCASGGGITGSGTANYISKFTGPGSIGDSSIYDNGNVGIGTTNPLAKLQLHGMFSQGGTPYGTADFTLRAADATTGMAIKGSSTYLLRLLDASDNPLFNVGGTGNVGIGTTTTPEKLTISAGNIQLDNNYSVKSKTNVGGIVNLLTYTSGNLTRVGANTEIELGGYVAFRPAGVEVARIISSGNFGIGTTAPAAKLNVSTSGTAGIVEALRLGYNNAVNSGSSIGFWAGNTTTETARIEHNLDSSTTSSLRFYTYNSGLGERLRISANGNVGIGSTSPTDKLDVVGNITASGDIKANGTYYYGDGKALLQYSDAWLRINPTNAFTSGIYAGTGTFRTDGTLQVGLSGSTLNVTSGGDLNFGTGILFADNAGNVGIGSTSPAAKLDIAGNVNIQGATKEYFSGQETRTYRNVAQYNVDAATQTGTVKIAIPTAKNNSTTMQVIKITGYNYVDNGGAWEAIVSGYNYTSGWINTSAEIRGSAPFTSVRLGTDGTTDVILLGDTATVWQYPQIFIDTVHVGYSNEEGFDGTWTLSMITDETGITVEKTPTIKTFIATNGNFGIGTTSPSYKLDVSGGTGIVGQFSGRVIGGNAVNSNEFVTLSQLTGGTGQYWTRTGSNLYPSTITDNVGIGTSTPGTNLHVFGSTANLLRVERNSASNAHIETKNTVGSFFAGINPTGNYGIGTSNDLSSAPFIVTSAGNVGIGSTAPGAALEVIGGALGVNIAKFGRTSGATAHVAIHAGSGDPQLVFNNTSSDKYALGYDVSNDSFNLSQSGAVGTTDVFVVKSGNVGIGTTAPASLLQVRGTVPSLVLNNTTTNTANSGTIDFLEDDNALGSAAGYGFRLNYEGVGNRFAISSGNTTTVDERLTILRSNGNVGIGSTAPGFKLDVAGTGRFTGLLTLGAQATGTTHAVRADRDLIAGSGLTGGGNLTADRTFNVGAGSCITVAADSVAVTSGCVNATTLDSIDSTQFLRSDTSDQFTSGTLTMNSGTILDINGDLSIADTDIAFDGASTNFAFTGNFSINTDDLFLNKTSGNLGIGTTTPTSRLSLASDGTVTNLFDITDSGSTIFQVTQSNIVANVPAQFNAAGDVSIAYDLNFTNPTASYIKSNAPLYLTSGKTYNSSDLTLETYNKGNVIVNTEALSLTGSATISAELTLSSKTTNGGVLYTNGSGLVSQSDAPSSNECLIFNGTSPVWDSCASGGGITGSGTTNYVPKFTGASSIGNSTIYDNGNVGIGTTTTTQKLTVLGSIDASVQFLGQAADTAAAPSFSWTGDTNVGMYRPTTDTIGFTTAGSEKVRIASNGNVGIGSTSPGQKLDVNGVARATNFYVNAAAGNGIGFWNGAPSTYGIFMSNSASYQYGDVTDYYIANVMSSGTSRGFVWSYGTVPSMALNANSGNLALKGNLTVNGTGNSSIGGNLGIGTTVPGANLGIIPSTGNASILLSADPSNTVETHNPFLKLTQDGGIVTGILGFSGAASVDAEGTAFTGGLDNSLQLINKYSTNLQLGTNGAARLTISNAGLVTLANYTTSGGLLYTNGSGLVAQTGTGTGSQCLLGGATPSWGSCSTGSITGSGTTNYLAKFTGSGTIGNSTIYDNGNVGIGTTVPNALLAVAGNTRINGIQVDESLGYDQPIYFSPQAYFEAGSTTAPFPVYTIDGFTTVNDTSVPFSKVASSTSYDQIYSDYIPVQPGDTLYGEMWAHRASGAVGTAGTLYYGIERYDKDKNPIAINNGTDYFVAAGQTVPTTGVWTKYSSQTTLPTSHTVYNSSDGGPVRYVRVRILVNYNAGTIPTEWGGIILRRVAPYRDSGNIAFNGNVGIGSLSPAYNLDVNGTFRASSTSNAVFGNGTTGGLAIGDGTLTKTSGSGFAMNSGLTLSQNLDVNGTGTNTFAGDISMGSAAQIQFATTAEDKLYLYTNTYGIGIESSTLTNWSGSQFRWRTGGTSVSTGTERMLLTTTGLTLVGDLAVNGGDITSTVDLTLNPAGGDVILADTRTLMIGGHAGAIAYNAISNAGGAANSGVVTTDNDLYIQGDLEVDGAVHGGSFVGSINPGFTLGSVPFQGASGLTQDNANFYWDDTNNRLGIGTAAPSHSLTVSTGSIAAPQMYDYDNTAYYADLAATGNSLLTAGNAGIGTTSPLVKLHVVKGGVAQTWTPDTFDDVAIFEGSNSTMVSILSGNTGYGQLAFSDVDDRDVGRVVYGHTNNTMSFFTNDTERITILSNGNVGIGSTAPVQKLQVAGYVRGDTGLCISTDCRTSWPTGGVTGSGTTNYVAKFTAAGAVGNSSIYDNGNVGVGTASPRTKLHVADASGIGIYTWGGIAQTYSSASIVMGSNIYVDPADVVNRQVRSINTHATYGHAFAEFYGGDIVFNAQTGASTANAIVTKVERMRIEGTNGNVGIGSTAPAQKLDVTGNIALSGTLLMNNTETMQARNSTGTYETFMWPRWSDNVMYTNFGANGWNIRNNSSSSVMFLESGGDVGIGTTNPDRLFTVYFNNGNTATSMFNFRQDSTGDAWGNFSLGAAGASYAVGIDNSDADKFKIGYNASGPSAVSTGTLLTIATNGNVGIGTTNPTSKLRVEGGFFANGDMHANGTFYVGGTSGTSTWNLKTKSNVGALINQCDGTPGGTGFNTFCISSPDGSSEMKIYNDGNVIIAGGLTSSGDPDVAEQLPVNDPSINEGDILSAADPSQLNNNRTYDNVMGTKSSNSNRNAIIGVVSTNPSMLIGQENAMSTDPTKRVINGDRRAMVLAGRIPTKVSTINGPIQAGDLITASDIPGVGMKATTAGTVVGRALQAFTGSNDPHAQTIPCPEGTTTGVQCGKIIILLNVSWVDPEIQIAQSGNLSITGTDAGSFKAWAGQYNFTRKGGFAEAVVAKLVAGITTTQQLVVNGQTQLLGTVKIGTQTLQEYILSVVQNAGMTNNSSESDQIATNIISPLANGKITIDGDTEVNGTLKAKKIIADEIEGLDAKIATLSANTIVASQAAITNITNITNVYNTASNSAQSATDSATVASDSAEVATDEADLATDSASASDSADMTEDFTDGEIQTEYMDLASSSAALAYTPTLSSEFATFTKGLMSFGPSTFADVSVTGQLSVNGSLIMAENSINTLGGTLEIQPLAQGDVSFMAGLMTLDTEGNLNVAGNAYFAKDVTVKGTLAAHIISPVPSEDLIIRLPSMLADGPNRDSKLVIQNASGSGVLEITNTGDLTASGAGQFANIAAEGFSIIRGAQADISATQTVASSSAGVATIKANYTERTIVSDFVTEDSLIYLTPVGATGGLQPYVARQTAADPENGIKGSFTIQIPSRALSEMKINWFIVN